jgi:hypothetical protein
MAGSLKLKLLPSQLSSLSSNNTIGVKGKQRSTKSENKTAFILDIPGTNPKITSSVYGKLKTIILFFPTNGAYSIYPYFEFLKELITKLKGGGRRFLLISEANALSRDQCNVLHVLAAKEKNQFHQITITYYSSDLAPWAQDSFLSITYEKDKKNHLYLIEPSNKSSNRNAAKELVDNLEHAKISNIKLKHSNSLVPFVGGNVLISERFTLIGINGTDKWKLKEHGEDWLGKNIILLESKSTDLYNYWSECYTTKDGYCNRYQGSTKGQAIFHLDIFITLAGKNDQEQEILVVGEPVIGFFITDDMSSDVKDLIKQIITQTTEAINQTIDTLHKELQYLSIPFKIIRNPLPLTYYDEVIKGKKTRYWCWATYNNCLIEYYYTDKGLDPEMIKNVIMPSYGISSDYSSSKCEDTGQKHGSWTDLHIYDLQNQWLWEMLGYNVTLMRQDYNPFTRRQGSLNCLTNCIERE